MHGAKANDLVGNDSGCDGDGVVRKVRTREASGGKNKKRKGEGWCEIAGYWWKDGEIFEIERLLDKKVERRNVGKVAAPARPLLPSIIGSSLHVAAHHPPYPHRENTKA